MLGLKTSCLKKISEVMQYVLQDKRKASYVGNLTQLIIDDESISREFIEWICEQYINILIEETQSRNVTWNFSAESRLCNN